MRGLKAGFAALALAGMALAGCGQQSGSAARDVEALVTKLTTETFKGTATSAVSLEAVRAALPAEVALSWASSTFEASTGATLLTDVRLTPKDMPEVGFQVAELRLWDFNADLLAARMKGERLAEAGVLARRIDAKNVQLFGVAQMLNGAMAVPAEPAIADPDEPTAPETTPAAPDGLPPPQDVAPDAGPGPQIVLPPDMPTDMAELMPRFDRYDFKIGRIVLDTVSLRPFEMAQPVDIDYFDSGAVMMSALQPLAAISRSFTIDAYGALDMGVDFAMEQMGATSTVKMGIASMGAKGVKGGDLDAGYLSKMSYVIDQAAQPDLGVPAMNMQASTDFVSIENVRLDNLYSHLAQGKLPPRTQANALSLGTMKSEKSVFSMGGKEIYSVAESTLSAEKFHWLVPTDLRMSAKDISINMAGAMELGQMYASAALAMPDMDFGQAAPDLAPMIASLKKHGLETITGDMDFGWTWNATSGDAKLDLKGNADNFMDMSARYEGGFPSFDAVSALIPENGEPNMDALASLFDARSTLKLADFTLSDRGGLEKIFGFSVDAAKASGQMMPEGMDDPKAMRQMGSMAVQMIAMQAPDMASFVTPIGNFIELGGRLHIEIRPGQPMTFAEIGRNMFGTAVPPAEGAKRVGLKVEHSK